MSPNIRSLRVLACAFLFSFQTLAFPQQETAEQFVERVKKAIVNEEWGRAHAGIKHALDLNPKSPEVNFVAAQLYWRERALSMAISCLKTAIEAQPVYPQAHLLLAKCLKEVNNRDQAREELNIALSQGASASEVYCVFAELDILRDDFDAAAASIETASRYFSEAADGAALKEQIEQTRSLVQKLQEFAKLVVDQKGSDVVRPVMVTPAMPRYTEEARRDKIQGKVWLGILVSAKGEVESILLLRGLGYGLDEQAQKAMTGTKFQPATRNGNPIRYWMKSIIVEFNLK